MKPTPILFLGDSPDLHSGLGRIGRDLAVLTSSLPEFRVGYLGRGGVGSRRLPFAQYNVCECDQWAQNQIEQVWMDFAPDEWGIIMSVWDASRLLWFVKPDGLPQGTIDFLQSGWFARWGYFAVDATGVNNKLTATSRAVIEGYDRPLAYTMFGSEIIGSSIGKPVDWMPHGLNLDRWTPRDREAARMAMGFNKGETWIGMVATNQARKDWGLAFSVINELRRKNKSLKFWIHTDVMARSHAWNIDALIHDYGMERHTKVTLTGGWDDTQLSYAYSACDATMLCSLGEGFGYPIAESLACGTPCVHGSYGGGAELLPTPSWAVQPQAWRLESLHNCVRPVYDPVEWATVMQQVLDEKPSVDFCRQAVSHLEWGILWPATWKKWFLAGLPA